MLRGRIHFARENSSLAVKWFMRAAERDPLCSDAWDMLCDEKLISPAQAKQLLAHMRPCTSPMLEYFHRSFAGQCAIAPLPDNNHTPISSPSLQSFTNGNGNGNGNAASALSALMDPLTMAEKFLLRNQYQRALELLEKYLTVDPHHPRAILLHLCALYSSANAPALFLAAHQLVTARPDWASSYVAIGLYYLLLRKAEIARRYFHKASRMQASLALAWIGFGHAFVAEDDTDQAMVAYRTASRRALGCADPLLYLGMEYARTHNLSLAKQFLGQARQLESRDPVILNELGIVAYHLGQWSDARQLMMEGLQVAAEDAWEDVSETLHANLGHVYRKMGSFEKALEHYKKAHAGRSMSHAVYVAIGFTHHLMGNLAGAVESYHMALSLKADDAFATEMLDKAMEEEFGSG